MKNVVLDEHNHQFKINIVMKTITFKVSSTFSSREITARSKKEAKGMFLKQVPSAKGERLTVK